MSSGVEFEEDKFGMNIPRPTAGGMPQNIGFSPYLANEPQKGLTGFLIRHGLAKSNRSAQVILIGIIIINIIIIFIAFNFFL